MTRYVLVTGCSSGIGQCLATGLAARGYRVIAGARKPADVAALAATGLEAIALDVASSDSIAAACAEVERRTQGRLYALINNAGYGQPGAVEDLRRDVLRAQFETNVFGAHELTTRLLPMFRAAGAGRIIQISSLLGLVCLAYRGAYNASKFALEALSDTLRLELRGSGIHVTLIEPGPIKTRFRDNSLAAFAAHIDPERSAHRERYQALLARLTGQRGRLPFTLPPEAVLKRVIHALEADRPKIRYYVTFPTYLFAALRRLLPAALLDRVAYRVGAEGRR